MGEPNELQKDDRSYHLIPAYFLGLRVDHNGQNDMDLPLSHQA